YSDPYVIFCLIVPVCGSYLLLYKNKNVKLNILFFVLLISSALTYLFGNRIIELVIPDPPRFIQYNQLALQPISQIIPNFILFVQGIAYLLNDNLYQIGEYANPLNLCISALLLIIGGYLIVVYLQKTETDTFFKHFLITGFVLIFIFYVFTSMSSGFMTTRYLIFPAIAILLGISLSYSPKKLHIAALILILLIISVMGSLTSGQKFESDSNPNQTELIQFLDENKLYYGYSDYWDANLITYLSKFKIMVRSLAIHANDSIETYPYNNNDNWYNYPEGADVFMLTSKPGYSINDDSLHSIMQVDPPKNKMRCNEYSIYAW
ncbi:MAG: hypothetical protein LUQ50_10240, partial [Methanospirillum sp.]|uniref:hypothetical protein n=1 Tax=Methanospirillum sp. TaxID=45200 RepID=UPI0023757376